MSIVILVYQSSLITLTLEIALVFTAHRIADAFPVGAQCANLIVRECPPLEPIGSSDGLGDKDTEGV